LRFLIPVLLTVRFLFPVLLVKVNFLLTLIPLLILLTPLNTNREPVLTLLVIVLVNIRFTLLILFDPTLMTLSPLE
jgi:hypothetical protein